MAVVDGVAADVRLAGRALAQTVPGRPPHPAYLRQ